VLIDQKLRLFLTLCYFRVILGQPLQTYGAFLVLGLDKKTTDML